MKFEHYDKFNDIIPSNVTDMAVTQISEHTNGKIKLYMAFNHFNKKQPSNGCLTNVEMLFCMSIGLISSVFTLASAELFTCD